MSSYFFFFFKEVTQLEVNNALTSIKSKAEGADGIPITFINKLSHILLPIITDIYNLSFRTGKFPKSWKQAIVKPILKSSNLSSEEYRPISFLSVLSKALEKLAHRQITEYLNKNSILNRSQSGFRKLHSAASALVKITDDFHKSMDESKLTILIFIRF